MPPPPDSATSVAETPAELRAPAVRVASLRRFVTARRLGFLTVGLEMLALLAFGIRHASILITREDEVLALFVGRSGFVSALHQVLNERGGAPLHFVSAWTVVQLGGHLVALRIVSTCFVVGALPLIALLATRLARDGRVGVVAATLAAPSWLVLFSGDFARMYAQFLFFGTLAPLLLLRALDRQRTRDWVYWWLACLGVLASHPYGAFVLAAGIAALLATGWRQRRTWVLCAIPVVAATPFWIADFVLRARFDVGVGGGGSSLGSLHGISRFLLTSFRDATSWHGAAFWIAAVLAPAGAFLVARASGAAERVLLLASFVLPIVALLGARADSQVSPETRHLIFLLPFLDLFVAAALVRGALLARRAAPLVAVAVLAIVVAGQIHSARQRTPDLFGTESGYRHDARLIAAQWLGLHATPNVLLMGYEPVFYEAWRGDDAFSSFVVARADSAVAAKQLERYCGHFTQAVFVFDRENGYKADLTEARFRRLGTRLSSAGYGVKRFDDFMLVLSAVPSGRPRAFVRAATPLLRIARDASIQNGKVELRTLLGAAPLLRSTCS